MSPAALLPGRFEVAADPARIGPLLADLLGGARLDAAELVDQKEGRALFRYRLGPGSAGDNMAMAKLYADEARAARVCATMQALHDDVFADEPGLDVPRPLGWLPSLGLVLYQPLAGTPLPEVVPSERRLAAARRAAEWLAVLHGCGLPQDRRLDLDREVANAALWAALVDDRLGATTTRASVLAAAVGPIAGRLALDDAAVLHKDFHHEHVLVSSSGEPSGDGRPAVGVIDLDEARHGDPAYDLAHFCANLALLARRGGLDGAEHDRLRGAFLGEYADRTGWRPDERFSFFRALHGVKLAKQIATGRGPGPRPAGEHRAQEATAAVEDALAWMP